MYIYISICILTMMADHFPIVMDTDITLGCFVLLCPHESPCSRRCRFKIPIKELLLHQENTI